MSPDPPRPDPFKPRPDLLPDPFPQEQDWWVGDQPDLYPDDEEDDDEWD